MNPIAQLQTDIGRGDSIQGAARRYLHSADANAEGFVAARNIKLDCRSGCALCCVFRVEARAHEIFAIADYICSKFSPEQKAALIVRLEAHAEKVSSMSAMEHKSTNVPCPMLVDSSCSIYPARPFGCRSHHSKEVASCQYSYDNPADMDFPGARDMELIQLWKNMAVSAHGVFERSGFDRGEYELGTAVLSALKNPATGRRWRQKKNPLLEGSDPPNP